MLFLYMFLPLFRPLMMLTFTPDKSSFYLLGGTNSVTVLLIILLASYHSLLLWNSVGFELYICWDEPDLPPKAPVYYALSSFNYLFASLSNNLFSLSSRFDFVILETCFWVVWSCFIIVAKVFITHLQSSYIQFLETFVVS